jgi:metal-responsive CopG/Arc/MetJ family transcriptional regulator
MDKSAKVTISLPETILKAIEKERKAKGENRSEFFRRAAENLLKKEKQSKEAVMYIRGYRNIPESTQEIKVGHQTGVDVLAGEPW